MDAHGVLTEMLHTFNVNYGGALDPREEAALRAALTPWVTWMVRPQFNPLRDDQVAERSQPCGHWQIVGNYVIPPDGFTGTIPEWAYEMTRRSGFRIKMDDAIYWRTPDGQTDVQAT